MQECPPLAQTTDAASAWHTSCDSADVTRHELIGVDRHRRRCRPGGGVFVAAAGECFFDLLI